MAPWRWTPLPGRHEKLGASLRARFTLPDDPSILKFSMPRTKSAGRSDFSIILRNVRFGSAPDAMTFAWSFSPLASSTPIARPSRTRMRRTSAFTRISAPKRRGARGIDSLTIPMPLRTSGHEQDAPSVLQLRNVGHLPAALRVLLAVATRDLRDRLQRVFFVPAIEEVPPIGQGQET